MASRITQGLIFARTPIFEAAQPCNFHGHIPGNIHIRPECLPASDHPLDSGVWSPKGSGDLGVAVPLLKVLDDGIFEIRGELLAWWHCHKDWQY